MPSSDSQTLCSHETRCVLLCICVQVCLSASVVCISVLCMCLWVCTHVCVMHPCVCVCVHMHTCVCGNFEEVPPPLRGACCPETVGSLSTLSSPPHPPHPTVLCPQALLALGPHSKSALSSPSPSTSGLPTSLLPGFIALPSATRGKPQPLGGSPSPSPGAPGLCPPYHAQPWPLP